MIRRVGPKSFQGAEWGKQDQRQVHQEYESCIGMSFLYGGCLKRSPEIHVAHPGILKCSGSGKTSQDTIDRHRHGTLTCATRLLS